MDFVDAKLGLRYVQNSVVDVAQKHDLWIKFIYIALCVCGLKLPPKGAKD